MIPRALSAALAAIVVAQLGSAQPSPARPRVTGISHVAFRVTDAAAARHFYADVLGLTERAGGGSRMTFAIGSRQRVLIEPGLPADEDERLSHLAFETADVKGMAAYLGSRGIQVTQPATRCEESAVSVQDPDGHPIEFVQANWPPDKRDLAADRALSHRLLHAGLIVRDEEAAHRFYRDVLGFSEIWRGGRPEGVTQWVNMRVPDGTEYIEYMLASSPPTRRQRGTQHHLCLLVPEIQSAWEEAARRVGADASSALPSPPNVGVNGKWQLNLYDPDGTRTELMEAFRVR
jgi:lactoylglutathione lyase